MMNQNWQAVFEAMARPEIRELEAYDAGVLPEQCVRVCANENNEGLSPKAQEAMIKAIKQGNRYPDSSCTALRRKLAQKWGINPEGIIVSNGLDGLFTMLGRAFLSPGDEVVCAELTFSVYSDTARIMGALPVQVPMTDDLGQDLDGFVKALSPKTKMVICCNPINPTGLPLAEGAMAKLLDAVPSNVMVLLDEAYIEFDEQNVHTGLKLLERYPNLIVCRTFSKIYGLAGLRIGWAAADPRLIDYLCRVREPYAVSDIAVAGALAALDDQEFIEKSRRIVAQQRQALCRFLDSRQVKYIASRTNFLLVFAGEQSQAVFTALKERAIYVRLLSFKGEKMLRISIGTAQENAIVQQALAELL